MALLPSEIMDRLPFSLRGELEENLVRKDFTQRELAEFQSRLRYLLKEKYAQGRPTNKVGNLPTLSDQGADNVDEIIAEAFDEGFRTVQKRRAIYEAARQDPERFGALMDDLEQTGKVDPIYRRLKTAAAPQKKLKKPAVRRSFIFTEAQDKSIQAAIALCGGEDIGAALSEICAFYVAKNK